MLSAQTLTSPFDQRKYAERSAYCILIRVDIGSIESLPKRRCYISLWARMKLTDFMDVDCHAFTNLPRADSFLSIHWYGPDSVF